MELTIIDYKTNNKDVWGNLNTCHISEELYYGEDDPDESIEPNFEHESCGGDILLLRALTRPDQEDPSNWLTLCINHLTTLSRDGVASFLVRYSELDRDEWNTFMDFDMGTSFEAIRTFVIAQKLVSV